MNQEYLDKLEQASHLIFEVEQKLRKEKQMSVAHILYLSRININNVENNIKNT